MFDYDVDDQEFVAAVVIFREWFARTVMEDIARILANTPSDPPLDPPPWLND
jgi:hypothetical protein